MAPWPPPCHTETGTAFVMHHKCVSYSQSENKQKQLHHWKYCCQVVTYRWPNSKLPSSTASMICSHYHFQNTISHVVHNVPKMKFFFLNQRISFQWPPPQSPLLPFQWPCYTWTQVLRFPLIVFVQNSIFEGMWRRFLWARYHSRHPTNRVKALSLIHQGIVSRNDIPSPKAVWRKRISGAAISIWHQRLLHCHFGGCKVSWPMLIQLPAWGFLLVFYKNHSPKMLSFWSMGMGKADGWIVVPLTVPLPHERA